MPEQRTVQLIGAFGASGLLLTAELGRLGYLQGSAAPSLVVVLVESADDERALLGLSAATSPTLAVLGSNDPACAHAAALAGARGLLDLPLRRSAIAAQLMLALAASAHQRRLESKAALLERTLKGRHTIEKATQLLATERGISQAGAYEVLRKAAMSGRITMADMAGDYLLSHPASLEA